MSQTQYNAINQTKLIDLKQLQNMPVGELMQWLAHKQPWMQQAVIRSLAA